MRPAFVGRKLDRNHKELKGYAEALGLTATTILGEAGCPDLLVGGWCVTRAVEVKPAVERGKVSPSQAKLREDQEKWHKRWRGSPVAVWRTETDVEQTAREMREESECLRAVEFERAAARALEEEDLGDQREGET